jgi:hypothetical protein
MIPNVACSKSLGRRFLLHRVLEIYRHCLQQTCSHSGINANRVSYAHLITILSNVMEVYNFLKENIWHILPIKNFRVSTQIL